MSLTKEQIIIAYLETRVESGGADFTIGKELNIGRKFADKLLQQIKIETKDNLQATSLAFVNGPIPLPTGGCIMPANHIVEPEISIKPSAIHRAAQKDINPDFNKQKHPVKLSNKQNIVLDKIISMVADAIPTTINAIAKELREGNKNAYYLVTALKNKGYLERHTNPNGRGHTFTPLKNLDGSDFDPDEKAKQPIKTVPSEEKKIPFDQTIGPQRYEDDPRALNGDISCKTILNS